MCDCERNVVDLQKLKIYTIMAKYKILVSSQEVYYGDASFINITKNSSQEELAFVYEELGLTKLVEKEGKTEKTNKTTKTDAKKVNKVKETNESEKESGNEEKDKE